MLRHLTVSKALLILGITIFSTQNLLPSLSLPRVFAQSQVSLQNQLDDAIHERLKANDEPSHKSQFLSNLDITSPEKIPNQNIYLRTLNSFTQEISPSIYEGMSLVTGLSVQELQSVIELDDIRSLQRNSDSIQTTQSRYRDLLELYEQEKDFFRSLAKIRQEAAIYEIFTDNNSQNSGFDLLTDLNQIEEKLFQQGTPNTISYSNRDRSNFWNQYNSSPFISTFAPVNFTSFSTSTPVQDPISNPTQTPTQPTTPDSEDEPTFQFPSLQYGSICQVDPEFKEEIDIFRSQNETDSQNNSQESQIDSNNTNPIPSSPLPIQTQIANYSSTPFQINFNGSSQSCPADQVFCFTQELKFNQVDLIYPEGSDCVSCIINRLNQNLQNLLDKGVLPQKITGNFGEPALCKQAAYGKIGLNLNIFSKPIIPQQPDSSSIQGLNPSGYESLANQQKSLSNSGFSITEDSNTQRDLNLLSQTNTQEFITQFDQNLDTDFSKNSEVAQKIQAQQQHFDSLSEQINTLNFYFESFNTSLDQMNQNFVELVNLPECSTL